MIPFDESPMPFDQVFGHRRLLGLLARAVARESLPPSLIFAGGEGVGKFTTAVALAEVLNCTAPRPREAGTEGAGIPHGFEVDACGSCASCRRVQRAATRVADGAETGLDCFRVLQPDDKGSIKIDPVRALVAACAYRPFDGRRRLVVLDEADALEVAAQNALLKVLEEPPPGTVFVLLTTRPDALLPTIRSRCPRLRFGPLKAREIAGFLVARRGAADRDAQAAAARADGSIARALADLEGDPGDARRIAAEVLGLVATTSAVTGRLAAAQALIARAEGAKGKKSSGAATRAEVAGRLRAMAALLRDVQVLSAGAGDRWLANTDLDAELGRLTRAFEGERVVRAFAAVDRALYALERNVGHKNVADWVALEL
jgi:DNA polymerase-3 subunit delta'